MQIEVTTAPLIGGRAGRVVVGERFFGLKPNGKSDGEMVGEMVVEAERSVGRGPR